MPNNSRNSAPPPNISTGDSTTDQLIKHGRDIHMYGITDVELDVLKSNYNSWSFGFCALCLGIFIGFFIPLVTVQLSDRMCAIFVAVTIASGGLALFSGIRFGIDRGEAKRRIKQIKERPKSN